MTPTNVRKPPDLTTYSAPQHRSAYNLVRVIEQFHVGTSGRYVPRDTSGDGKIDTHCDAFACDVALAMGVVLPSEVLDSGDPAEAFKGRELNANGTIRWLRQHGPRYGWQQVTEGEARAAADQGRFAVATWLNVAGSGHIAVLRPSEGGHTMIAQAGRSCFEKGPLAQGFGGHSLECEFWANE
jgi:hypothetical protein